MTVRERPHDVVVLREHELVRWLQRHPVTLSPEQVRHLANIAAQSAAWQRPSTTPHSIDCTPRSTVPVGGGRGGSG